MKNQKTKMLVLSFILSTSVASFADTACSVKKASMFCGGIEVVDNGCSISCAASGGWEALCHPSECNTLPTDHKSDFVCEGSGLTCIIGPDGLKRVVNPSSCFCD
jgi:hypothetical protein